MADRLSRCIRSHRRRRGLCRMKALRKPDYVCTTR
jgi:hypothetical protein